MRNKLLFIFWLLATVGVTYVANTAVGLVDLQMFPNRTRIEVLTLSEPEDVSPDPAISVDLSPGEQELNSNNSADSDSGVFTAGITTLPVIPTSTTVAFSDLNSEDDLKTVETKSDSESSIEENEEFLNTTTTSIPINTTTLPTAAFEESASENPPETIEILENAAQVTTTTIEIEQLKIPLAPLAGVAMETIELRVGAEYQRKLITGGEKPYQTNLLDGRLPDGLNVDKNGEIKGNPSKSGVFEAIIQTTDANQTSIQQLISFIVSEYRFISANGGSVTVIITGESVRFFSALNATGYEPAVVSRQGPLIVEVSFLPISDDQLSWVRCEVIENSVECDKN
ncbi:MAG: hypothetical protein P8L35_00685 [Acidimicrobiales bacterium]|nr:hypothetical protein [Acidimicrobiales bacterium]